METLHNPTLVKAFAIFVTTWLAAVTGGAAGMYLFAIPLIKNNNQSSSTMLHQFHHLITLGQRYMQTSMQTLVVLFLSLSYILYNHPDPELASRWKYFALTPLIAVQALWFEIVFVFPTNDRLVEMKGELKKKADGASAEQKVRGEVVRLLEKWQFAHIGRIVIPLVATVVAFRGMLL